MTNEKIVAKLHKTRASIVAHIARGAALSLNNGEPNYRSCELVDRYNDLKAAIVGDYAAKHCTDWVAFCKVYGSCESHSGYDLFA